MPVHVEIDHPDRNAIWLSPKFLEGDGHVRVSGVDNTLHVEDPLIPGRPFIELTGGAHVLVGKDCNLGSVHVYALASGASIEVGPWTSFNGTTQIAAHEAARITIGIGCLFGSGCEIMASDVHQIVDVATGTRLNPAGDIVIEDHVWCGPRVMILRDARVGHDSVAGAGSVITGTFPPNVVLAGVPARIVKTGVTWRF